MNAVMKKLTQAGLMTMFGYEIGQNVLEKQVIVHVDESKLRKGEIENNHSDSSTTIILIAILILLTITIWLSIFLKMCMKRENRNRAIELREFREAPIV